MSGSNDITLLSPCTVRSGLVTVMFVDLITLHTQFSSWLLALSGDVQSAYERALVYCQGSKLKDFDLVIQPLTKHNLFRDDPKTQSLYRQLEMDRVMDHLAARMRLFRECHEERKQEVLRDAYGNVDHYNAPSPTEKKIAYNNDNGWYPPTEVFKIKEDLPASVTLNTCNNEWICVATNDGLREINIDWSLRFRLREEDRTKLVDAECSSFSECMLRFREIECPRHTELFGPSPFGGSGDQRHAKPQPRSQLDAQGIFPVNPLLPRIQLRRSPSFEQYRADSRMAGLAGGSKRGSFVSSARPSKSQSPSITGRSSQSPAIPPSQPLFDRKPSDL